MNFQLLLLNIARYNITGLNVCVRIETIYSGMDTKYSNPRKNVVSSFS